jgi:hypothetical protein
MRRSRKKAAMSDDAWVALKCPPNIIEVFQAWRNSTKRNVGWCLRCKGPIKIAEDLFPMSNTHKCEEGRKLDATIRLDC